MTYQFRQSEPPTPRYWGWLGLLLLAAAVIWGSTRVYGQSAGDPKWFFRGTGPADQTGYVTKVANTLYQINSGGSFALLPTSTFANASHTHTASSITDFNTAGDARWSLLGHAHSASDITSGVMATARLGTGTANSTTYLRGDNTWQTVSAGTGDVVGPASATDNNVPLWDGTTGKLLKNGLGTSTGLNATADAGKVVLFRGTGGITASTSTGGIAIAGSSVDGVGGDFRSTNSWALYAGSANAQAAWLVGAGAEASLKINANGTGLAIDAQQNGGGAADIASFSATSGGMTIGTDGGCDWTGTGATTTRSNLLPSQTGNSGKALTTNGTDVSWTTIGGGGGTWGSITGTLSDQTDLQTEFDNVNSTLTVILGDYLSRATADQFANLPNGTKATPAVSDMCVLEDAGASWVKKGFTLGSLPISTATQTALDLKAPLASPTFTGTVSGITKSMVGLGNVENTALSTWAGSANITTLGTISTGTVPAANVSGLGTLAAFDDGDLLDLGLTFPYEGLFVQGPSGFLLDISNDATQTATRYLRINTGDSDRLLSLTGDASITGTNTGDQDLSSYATTSAVAAGYQPLDADLTSIAGLSATNDDFIQRKAGAWANRTIAQVKSDLGLSGNNTGDQSESSIEALVDLQDLQGAVTDAQVPNNITITNLSGTNTGDQTITLTGDVTGSGTGSFATTVAETELAALASTTSAADKVPYFTGSGTASTTDLKMGTEAAYSGTVTWTAGAAPSGANNIRQYYVQIGNMVTWTICLTYATAGTTVTNLSLTFPSEFPTPAIPTGFTGADVRIWNCDNARFIATPTSTGVTNVSTFFISRNAADTGFVIAPTAAFASSTVRQITFAGIYFTQ